MKPQVNFIIPLENSLGDAVIHFNTVEEIESVIDSLEECRAELEHQIEMERQRRREKKKRNKKRWKEDKREVFQLPVKLKNGDNFVVTCDEVIFNEDNLSFDYALNGELVMTIPFSSLDTEPDFEE